jgi:hypothetical protein
VSTKQAILPQISVDPSVTIVGFRVGPLASTKRLTEDSRVGNLLITEIGGMTVRLALKRAANLPRRPRPDHLFGRAIGEISLAVLCQVGLASPLPSIFLHRNAECGEGGEPGQTGRHSSRSASLRETLSQVSDPTRAPYQPRIFSRFAGRMPCKNTGGLVDFLGAWRGP